jgi:hypothetical protein
MTRKACALSVLFFLAACSGGGGGSGSDNGPPPVIGDNPSPPPAELIITGAIQKGPFLVGSTVLINKLTAKGEPTDATLTTDIEDSIGTFSFKTTTPGPVQIVADGYYFNELTGQPSSGTLTLKALYEVNEQNDQRAYVNIMTHLINDRALHLLAGGQLTFSQAISQAESEFLDAFSYALPVEDVASFSGLNIYDEGAAASIGNAYLLALSTAFYKYASIKALEFGTAPDAELTLVLNVIADDLAEDGSIQTEGFLDDFVDAVRSLDPQTIIANLYERSIVDYPAGLSVPDIARFLSLCAGEPECSWRVGAPMPRPARSIASAVYDGKLYVFGGAANNDILNNVYEYDPARNAWSPKASMPIASFDMQAHVIENHIYVVAAYGKLGFMNELLRYDPANDTWAAMTPKPTYRYQFSSAVVDGRLYVIGGEGTIDDGPWASGKPWAFKDLVEVYDPNTDAWTRDDAAPMPFAGASSCAVGSAIYIFGGVVPVEGDIERNRAVESFTMKFDPALGTWSTEAPMPEAAEGASCVSVGSDMYVLGGRSDGGEAMNSVRKYDADTDTWTTPSRLPSHRYWGAAAASDEIFILGGLGRDHAHFNAVEIFNPSP